MPPFFEWAFVHRKEWVVRPMVVVLVLALIALAAEADPVQQASASHMSINFEHALSSFVGGLVSLGLSLPVMLFRIGRAIEKLDTAAERLSRLEQWRDRHMESSHQ